MIEETKLEDASLELEKSTIESHRTPTPLTVAPWPLYMDGVTSDPLSRQAVISLDKPQRGKQVAF